MHKLKFEFEILVKLKKDYVHAWTRYGRGENIRFLSSLFFHAGRGQSVSFYGRSYPKQIVIFVKTTYLNDKKFAKILCNLNHHNNARHGMLLVL